MTSIGYGPRIPFKEFDGDADNYEDWEDSCIGGLRLLGLHTALPEYAAERPTEGFDLAKTNRAIYDYLSNVIDKTSHGIIRRGAKGDGATALKLLRAHYVRETDSRIHVLWKSLINMKMGENCVTEYLTYIDETISKLRSVDEKVSDALAVVCTLDGLSSRYASFIEVATQRSPQYKFEELKIALLSCEDRMKKEEIMTGAENVMSVKSDDNSYTKKKRNQFYRKKYSASKWCEFHQQNTDHITRDCPEMRKARDHQFKNEVQYVEEEEECDFSFYLSHEVGLCDEVAKCAVNNECDDSDLVLVDSGCTTHIERNDANFSSFHENFNPGTHSIKLADGEKKTGIVEGTGTVSSCFEDQEGTRFNVSLNDALFIPGFSQDILSVNKSVKSGCTITFSPEGSTLKTKQGKVFNIIEKDKLYYLQRKTGKSSRGSETVVETDRKPLENTSRVLSATVHTPGKHNLQEWHRILGHSNVKDIQCLSKVVDNMEITSNENFDCSTCVQAKMSQTISRYVCPDARAKRVLELVYCDLVGPITPISREGYRYSMTFIDEYSGAVKIYMLKAKSDATTALKKFLAETAVYGAVGRLRCDGGGEFTAGTFKSVCLENKIRLEFTAPYSPHQNGKCERSHRSVFEMARSFLLDSGLPRNLWPFAVRMAMNI